MKKNLREELYKVMETNSESSAQYAVAKEILLKLNNNEKLNSKEIAEKSFSSKPTVVRFAQSFGFEGFKEFNKEIHFQEHTYFFDLEPKEMHQSFLDYRYSLREYLNLLDANEETLINVAKNICQSKRIIIFASPENTFLGNVFAERLRFLGFNVFSSTKTQNVYLVNSLEDNDLAIFLTSGYDNDVLTQIWRMIKDNVITFVLGSSSQTFKFKNPNYLISIDLGQNILREQAKPFLIQYILDQIFNLIVYSKKEYLNTFMNPRLKI